MAEQIWLPLNDGLDSQGERRRVDWNVATGSLLIYTHRRTRLHVDDFQVGLQLGRERAHDAGAQPWLVNAALGHSDAVVGRCAN